MNEIPYQPKFVEYGVPYYESMHVENFGLPDLWGIWRYGVVESRETMYPIVASFGDMENAGLWGRPVHRYIRTERFEAAVMHLTGLGGTVPPEVMEIVEDNLWDADPETIWWLV